LDPKDHLEKVRHVISAEKGRGVDINEYNERGSYDFSSELTKKVWAKYEETLKTEKALDFDDLLLKTLKLLSKYPDVLEKYQDRYKYIHVDEYQDTNKVQNDIVELLAKKHQNICVVGDTDQNIYSWRGAEIKNMLHFEKTYPRAQTFFLEQNYRSTKNILAVANLIIEKNDYRIPKKLYTENAEGEKISIFQGRSEIDEAQFIAMKAKTLVESGVNPENIAVLYRANFQSRVLEDAFLAFGVDYQMLGTKFFERKEVKDCLSFIKSALNTDGTTDLLRIINIPPRGIGKTTIQKIIEGKEEELPEKTKEKLAEFKRLLLRIREALLTQKTSDALKFLIKATGMEDMYNTGQEEDTERLENIMELVSLASLYDDNSPEEGIEKFLTDSSLSSDQDSLDGKKTGVKLMTVHSSKGLEFQYVFVSGLEADLFPHRKMGERKSGEDNEEERRLFYVAITRAEKKLFLTWAVTRTIFGNREINSPSEFLEDIPQKYTEQEYYGEEEAPRKPLFSIDF
jgi:DNA helicase-2/ATP-dependent DNA helicase PcrA